MNFNNISKKIGLRKKIIIIIILLPSTIAGIIYFVVISSINDIKRFKDEIETQRIDLEIKYKKGQSLKKLSEDLKTVKPLISELDKIFINEDNVLGFITTLEKIAGDNRISQNINLLSSKSFAKNGYKKTPLQITTSGEFIGQLNYLIDLEALDYYININSLELTSSDSPSSVPGGQAGGKNINMLIFADTYWK